ncbi:hypothetical protein HYE68_007588 [Fusarium pseudograminearum]|nr:hypothetical protein HYE68_007588 [Fusarium pseudograminearum]
MTIDYEIIDPDGDTWIIISSPTVSPEGTDESTTTDDPVAVEEVATVEESVAEGPEDIHDHPMVPATHETTNCQEGNDPVAELWIKVSRKHLSVASRRARRMFQGDYLETQRSESDDHYHWKMEALFHPEALSIVLRIIHAQNQDLPDSVTLKMLVEIATVVDDLQCSEALYFFTRAWTSRISQSIPSHMCDDLIEWIFITSVFGLDNRLKHAMNVAMMESTRRIDNLGLPILPSIIEMNVLCPRPESPFPDLSLSSAFEAVRSFNSPSLYLPSDSAICESAFGCSLSLEDSQESVWVLEEDKNQHHMDWFGEVRQTNQTKSTTDTPKQLRAHQCRLQTHLKPGIDRLKAKAKALNLSGAWMGLG